jgi:hypothetical protein
VSVIVYNNWLLGRNSASRNSRGLIGLRIVKRVDFFQFTVADVHAIEDLIHAKDGLHFKDCCDKISLDNMLLNLDAFDGWQNTCQESDHSVPPDELSYRGPSKVIFAAKGILDISLPGLLTTQGTSVPAGDYTVYLEKDSHQHWTLKMMKPFGGKGLFILSPPMSMTTSALPIENPEVSFDHTGGSCMMHWSQKKSDTVLSLEFTEKNADMPILQ